MFRTICNSVACAVTLLAASVTGGHAEVRADQTDCTYVCTPTCPDWPEQNALCEAQGDCFATHGCPEDNHQTCASHNRLTLCWSN